jgi:patched 2 protein
MGIVTGFRWVLGTYHVAMNELFSSYGSFVAHKPFLPMIIGLLLFGGLSVGLVRRKTETDLEKLWVEHDSRVVDERIFFNQRSQFFFKLKHFCRIVESFTIKRQLFLASNIL